MRILAVVFLLILQSGLWAETSVPQVHPDASEVEIQGTVVFTDGTRQRNVNGRCVDRKRYNTYYAPNVVPSFDSAIKFGNEWHAGYDGTFKLTLQPGDYVLWAHGAKPMAVNLTVPADTRTVSVQVIGRTDNIVAPFLFLTPEGMPMRSMNVQGGIHSDANGIGAYKFDNYDPSPPESRFFWVKEVGYAAATIKEEDLLRRDPAPVIFSKGIFVSGSVVSKTTNAPLGGVVIFPLRDNKNKSEDEFSQWNGMFGFDPYSVLSIDDPAAVTSRDGDGFFELGPLPPGNYMVKFTLPDTQEMGGQFRYLLDVPLKVIQGNTLKPLNIKIHLSKSLCSLKGRIIDDRTKMPIANDMITINVWSTIPGNGPEHYQIREPVYRRVKTDRNGKFTLYPLDPRKLYFAVSWKGLLTARSVTLPVGKTVDFIVKPDPAKSKPRYTNTGGS